MLAVRQQLPLEQLAALANRCRGQVARRSFIEKFLDGLFDCGDVRPQYADPARHLPTVYGCGSGRPVGRVQAATDSLAADRALNPYGTLASGPPVAFRQVLAIAQVAAVERQACGGHNSRVAQDPILSTSFVRPSGDFVVSIASIGPVILNV